MRNIALVYATRYGQTEKIARRMKEVLESHGCVVECHNLDEVSPIIGPRTDGIILGAPVYAGHFQRSVFRWARRNQTSLMGKRIGLFVVSLNTADKHAPARIADDQLILSLIDRSGIVPDQVANFAGALKYTSYPWFVRPEMRKRAVAAGGDTDITKDFEYTDWTAVESYCEEFRTSQPSSPSSLDRRMPNDRAFNSLMRFFEQSSTSTIEVRAPQDVAFSAFSKAEVREMKGATALASIRTLGNGKQANDHSFAGGAEEFGVIPLGRTAPREILGGLVGQFWRFNFGIKKMSPDAFESFDESGFTKVLTRFEFLPLADGGTEIRVTMRIHSTDDTTKRRFRIYWTVLSLGISLYMKSIMHGLKRQAERQVASSVTSVTASS